MLAAKRGGGGNVTSRVSVTRDPHNEGNAAHDGSKFIGAQSAECDKDP